MTETTTTTISDDMCRAAIEAGKPDRIQGFTYEINGQVTHVVRDLTKPVGDSAHKLWVGSSHPEMMERCAIERMRLQLAAALAAPSPAPAAPSAAQPVAWMCEDLILPDDKPLFTQVREHAERRAEAMHEGKPAWRVTPLYAAAPGAQPAQDGAPPLEFGYTNWRGEYARRRVQPIRTFFGSTEWHPDPQWLMEATDLDKGEVRAFAVKDMVFGAQPAQDTTETAECRRILEEMTALFEMDDEAQQPGTDSYTVLKQAQDFLRSGEGR
ncbi:hypothetical protein [Azospirillum sp. TSO5]|uniref:hypothetical protein n=1 Tax=Azospirillum sp. TSO5 TaxID=716760 RepID=UPI000D609A75|nr:hypothetical protein [Azospirillum sp. TSO5]PWC96909.1 hypothetical protein TSO5_05590 [Azospirillum sp. TSO5]